MSKHRIWRGDAIVAGQSQVHATAHAVTANGSNYRNRKAVDSQHERLTGTGKLQGLRRRELGNLIQVSASRKESVIAGDNQRFHITALSFVVQSFNRREHSPYSRHRKDIGSLARTQFEDSAILLPPQGVMLSFNVNFACHDGLC